VRPIPTFRRGPRKPKPRVPRQFLALPRISPEWELAALTALMKPKPATRGPVFHTDGTQPWTDNDTTRAVAVATTVAARLDLPLDLIQPAAGEYHLLTEIPPGREVEARVVAVAVSKAVPDVWLVLGPLFVKRGLFYRRRRSFKLELVRAADIRLPRALRAKIRDVVQNPGKARG
jgi:hypothetical protein